MTVVAVVGLVMALQLFPRPGSDKAQLSVLTREARALREENRGLAARVQEAARNEQMFQAIQRAQQIVDEFSKENSQLQFETDQSLQFGEDLVGFDLNGFEPHWKGNGRERLMRFCEALSSALSRPVGSFGDRRNLFTIEVEGHTDHTSCTDDPYCNWRISSGRASIFVALMRDDKYCFGGASWNMVPVGLADTRPIAEGPDETQIATRRIAVRLVPNYKALIKASLEENFPHSARSRE
jgi:outer membrane protein OmpA-like peptidoglycan-associated protein